MNDQSLDSMWIDVMCSPLVIILQVDLEGGIQSKRR